MSEFNSITLNLNCNNMADEDALSNFLGLIFNYLTYEKKGVEILNLLAKNDNKDFLNLYFDRILKDKDVQGTGIFFNAIENNYIDIVQFLLTKEKYKNLDLTSAIKQCKVYGFNEMERILNNAML